MPEVINVKNLITPQQRRDFCFREYPFATGSKKPYKAEIDRLRELALLQLEVREDMATALATANSENQSLRLELIEETKKSTAILQEAILMNEETLKMKKKIGTCHGRISNPESDPDAPARGGRNWSSSLDGDKQRRTYRREK